MAAVRRRCASWATVVLVVSVISACTGQEADDAERPRPTTTPSASASSLADAEAATREAVATFDDIATGLVVLVRVGDETRVIAEGWANRAKKRRMETDDRFPIASITKPMVATAVLQYVDAGRIDLDDPIEKHLPGLLRQGDRITVRHLLSHKSGLHELRDDEIPPLAQLDDGELLAASAAPPLDFAPGTDGAYSNIGYLVLGLLVEHLSAMLLAEALDRTVFSPAGMSSTTLRGRYTVTGYTGGRVAADPLLRLLSAAGGVVSTAEDVDRFQQALMRGDLLSPELLDMMATPTGTMPFGRDDYGLGLWLADMPCGDALGHSGAMPGFATKSWTLRESERSTVVLVNDGDDAGQSVANYVAERALCG